MTKSKITLFTSPTQKLVIYLNPTKRKKENCVCKFSKHRNLLPEIHTSTNKQDILNGKESYPLLELSEDIQHQTEFDIFNSGLAEESVAEEICKKEFIQSPLILQENSNFIEKPNSEYVDFVDDDGLATLDDYLNWVTREASPHFAENILVCNRSEDDKSTAKDLPKMRGFEKARVSLNSEKKSDLQSLSPLKSQKSLSASNPESSIQVDENFVKNVATIIEASSLAARREKLDELLRNISAANVVNINKSKVRTKTPGCWPSAKTQKKGKKESALKPVPAQRRASLPFLNQSFYHYKAKSRLEGLTFEPHKVYCYGEKGSGFQSKTGSQDFYELRDECLANGTLYEDPEFPPINSSLFYSHQPDRRFEWKRPGEIIDNPQLFVEGFSRFDVQQGELGDCWLLAAVANLTLYRRLFFQIVPDDQGFEDNYAGIFHFRFWQYGRWIDVVIDDRLPTYRGELVFLHSTEANEFWSALLEKAYAKLHGSYEALKGGSTCEAMEDFTGGVTEMYEMNAAPPNLFKIILKAYERWSLMGCSIEPDPDVLEAQTPEGLIRGHAYSITKVQYVNIQTPNTSGKIPLLRLRNPWGNESEWNGPWSDNSPEWSFITDDVKQELGLNFDADGEFWMSFKDFQNHFNRVEICNLNPDSLSEDELTEGRDKKWVMSVFEGEWVRGVTAGGCRNFLNTFSHNPQYRVTLEEVDEGDEDDKCTMIVALMQKNRRQMRRSGGIDLLTIGFAIYYLPHPDNVPKPLDLNFFKFNTSVARSPTFINLREVSCRFKLPRGTYCIVPSTFDPNEEGEFLLRVFSEHQNNMEYDGSCSDNLPRSIRDNEVDDEDDERPPHTPYGNLPSNPYPNAPHPPSNPYSPPPSDRYSNPYPSGPYSPNPYPQNPYPYPQSSYGQYPYPQSPQPYPPQYPQYPPPNPPPRSSRGSDPITNFFNKLFR